MSSIKTFQDLKEVLSLLSKITYQLTSVTDPLHRRFQDIRIDLLLDGNFNEISKLDSILSEMQLADDLLDELICVDMDICFIINQIRKHLQAIENEKI